MVFVGFRGLEAGGWTLWELGGESWLGCWLAGWQLAGWLVGWVLLTGWLAGLRHPRIQRQDPLEGKRVFQVCTRKLTFSTDC